MAEADGAAEEEDGDDGETPTVTRKTRKKKKDKGYDKAMELESMEL